MANSHVEPPGSAASGPEPRHALLAAEALDVSRGSSFEKPSAATRSQIACFSKGAVGVP